MQRGQDTRRRILDAAQRQVLEHGFAATTIDAVLTQSGVSKGAFFHHFPSKSALGRALVERYAHADAAVLDEHMAKAEAQTVDPLEQLVALTRAFEDGADAVMEAQPGCLLVSFIYEAELGESGTDEIVAESIQHWRARILGKLDEAAAERPSLRDLDLPALADQWFTTFEGAFLLARATGDPDALRRQLSHLRHYLELLVSTSGDARIAQPLADAAPRAV